MLKEFKTKQISDSTYGLRKEIEYREAVDLGAIFWLIVGIIIGLTIAGL